MKQLQLFLAIIPLLMVVTISYVYAGGPRLDYNDDSTEEGAYCWIDGFDAGFAAEVPIKIGQKSVLKLDKINTILPGDLLALMQAILRKNVVMQ